MAAVDIGRVSATVGYSLSAANNSPITQNLPQRVAVQCEANALNQTYTNPASNYEWQATSLQDVGARYGFGSPAYLIARIALPILGGIPLVFYPQAQAVGAAAKVIQITPLGTANSNATHTLIIAGRNGLDAQFYNINIVTGDSSATITNKITNCVNGVLGCPFDAADNDYTNTLTSGWKGLTANDLNVTIDQGSNTAGITYFINTTQSGSGTPDISAALTAMVPKWNTILINSYGLNSQIASALEAWNGIPDPNTPTGRFVGTTMKPLIALSGSTLADPSTLTDPRAAQVTISVSPAPLSLGLPMEAAANDAATWAVVAQNTPELDVLNNYYVDMPTPAAIGNMQDYSERDRIVKLGCSTVDLVNGRYQQKDPVTTYHPTGDLNPAFRYRRDLMVDFNLRFAYSVLEAQYVVGKVLANDTDTLNPGVNAIKPKTWKQILITSLFTPFVAQGLIADADFSASSLVVGIDVNNPERFNTTFNYKKTGIARISATTVQSGFNVGTFTV